jgi:hypothetical protein
MKASTLIKELQSKIDEYGDLPVTFDSVAHAVNVGDVEAYDEEGNEPRGGKKPVEIYLHAGSRVG